MMVKIFVNNKHTINVNRKILYAFLSVLFNNTVSCYNEIALLTDK